MEVLSRETLKLAKTDAVRHAVERLMDTENSGTSQTVRVEVEGGGHAEVKVRRVPA